MQGESIISEKNTRPPLTSALIMRKTATRDPLPMHSPLPILVQKPAIRGRNAKGNNPVSDLHGLKGEEDVRHPRLYSGMYLISRIPG